MALTLDGSNIASSNSTSSQAVVLSTTNTNDVIIVVANTFNQAPTGISGGGLSWTQRKAVSQAGTGYTTYLTEWWAPAAAALSSASISVTTATNTYITVIAFGISGANTISPFDSNATLPGHDGSNSNPNSSPGAYVIWSTTNANDFAFVVFASSDNAAQTWTLNSGYSNIQNGASATEVPLAAEYSVLSSTVAWTDVPPSAQSFQYVPSVSTTNAWIELADAVVAASGSITTGTEGIALSGTAASGVSVAGSVGIQAFGLELQNQAAPGTMTIQESGVSYTGGAGSLVQTSPTGNSDTISASSTFNGSVAAGDIILVSIGIQNLGSGTTTVATVADNKLNAYTKIVGKTSTASGFQADAEIWYAIANTAGSSFTVTVNASQLSSNQNLFFIAYELNNFSVSGIINSTGSGTCVGEAAEPMSVTTFSPNQNAFVAASLVNIGTSSSSWAAGTGFSTITTIGDNGEGASMYQVLWAGGATTAPATVNTSGKAGYPWAEVAVGLSLGAPIPGTTGIAFSATEVNTVSITAQLGVGVSGIASPGSSTLLGGIDEQGNFVSGNIDQLGNVSMWDGLTSVGRRVYGEAVPGSTGLGSAVVKVAGSVVVNEALPGTDSIQVAGVTKVGQSPPGTEGIQFSGAVGVISAAVKGSIGISESGTAAISGGASTTGAISVALSAAEAMSQTAIGSATVQLAGSEALSQAPSGVANISFAGTGANSVAVNGSLGIQAAATSSLTLSVSGSFGIGVSGPTFVTQAAQGEVSIAESGSESVSESVNGSFSISELAVAQAMAAFYAAIEYKTLQVNSPEDEEDKSGETG